jgi:hypothetical protein
MDNVIPLRPRPAPEPEPLWREALGGQLREERTHRGERIADVAGRAGVALGISVVELTRRAGRRLVGGVRGGPVCLAA